MFDDVEAGPEVGPADAGRGADGAVAGQEGLGPDAGAGAQRGGSLAPPKAPVKRPCTSKLVRSYQRAQSIDSIKDLFRESNVYKMEDGSLKAVLLLQSHKKIYLYISDFLFTQCRLGHVSASFLSNRLDSGNMNNIDEITSKLRSSDDPLVVGRCPGKMDCQVTNVICLGCV